MKNGAIIRLVIYSVIALVLTGLLISVLVLKGDKGAPEFGFSFGAYGNLYKNSDKYNVGGGSTAERIHTLDIDWVSGKIEVIAYDGDTVLIEETEVEKEDYKLRWLAEDGKLSIKDKRSKIFFGFVKFPKKELTVKVPQVYFDSFKKLDIDSVSASITLNGINAYDCINLDNVSGRVEITDCTTDNLDIDNVSGNIFADNLKAGEINFNTVSGELTADGEIKKLDSDSVSGDVTVVSKIMVDEADCEAVSGDIKISIPENDGFTAKLDKVSGSFKSDFSTTTEKSKYVYKNGKADYNIDTVSGSFSVLRLAE